MKRIVFCLTLMALIGCSSVKPLNAMKFSGTVEITEHVLGTKSAGRVVSILVKEGDVVTKGQLLATLDRHEQMTKDLKRAASLREVGGISPQALENAQLNLEDQQVTSPVDGIVLLKTVETGEVVGAGAGLVVVGDPHDQWIKVFVPEGVINQLHINQSAEITFDGTKKAYPGHVSFIATQAEFTPRNVQTPEERVTQAFAVKVSFDNPTLEIRPGVAADVKFSSSGENKHL